MTPSRFTFVVSAVIFHLLLLVEGDYVVHITHNGPIVQGGSITFQAELEYQGDENPPTGDFRFTWADNTLQHHTWVDGTTRPVSTWNFTYPANKYYPGDYEVQVNVDKFEFLYWRELCSRRTSFRITAFLNGKMDIIQENNTNTLNNYVSNTTEVQHKIALSEADKNFLMNATQVITYWFVDCDYLTETDDFTFNNTYGTVGENHSVEALVVASFDPIITTTTTTTTSTTTTTTTTPPPSTSTTAKTISSTATSKDLNVALNSNEVGLIVRQGQNSTNMSHINVPYVCQNSSIVPPDRNKTYGYFHHQIYVKAPVKNVAIKGTNWLQQFELLNLQVLCSGSGNFTYCYYLESADYNTTGKESCRQGTETSTDTCQFNVTRYFSSNNYTVMVIIRNDVSKVVYPVKVTLYKVQKHAQLSVIVVPVVCSLVAVILIVFGVAYYVQRRKRFTVEVADFDFGQGEGDLEYKTFRERLREAVVNSLNRDFGVDGEGNVWSPSRKYGSMQ